MKGRKGQRRKKSRKGLFKKESLYGILFTVVMVSIVFTLALYLYFPQRLPSNQSSQTFHFKAAIVDHLSLTAPNQTFVQTATTILEEAGFTVDYYLGENVTVEFYRNLPTHDYGLIILRVHSAINPYFQYVTLFTSELYSQGKYFWEEADDRFGIVYYLPYNEGAPKYFGIPPRFIEYSMNGRFQNTIIIMMGCNGLTYTSTAEAFLKKGAKVYISWSDAVLSSHTDQATTQLLKHLVTENRTISQSVTETMKEVGPDPVDNSILLYSPLEARDYTIPKVDEEE